MVEPYPKFNDVIYDNGTWNVPYDNSGYKFISGDLGASGFTITADNIVSANVSEYWSTSIFTQDKIDVSKYSTLHLMIDGVDRTVNIASVSESGYIFAGVRHGYNNDWAVGYGVSKVKNGFGDSGNYLVIDGFKSSSITITKIWLE